MREPSHKAIQILGGMDDLQFMVQQTQLFYAASARPADHLGKYAKVYRLPEAGNRDERKYRITVSLDAVCQMPAQSGRAAIISMKPGEFGPR